MSINLDVIRQKLNALQSQQAGNKNIWKPEPGDNLIRIIPYQHNKENPFVEIYFHYNIGKKALVSPFTVGESDPIVEFSDKLKNTGSKDDWILGKRMEPKMRAFAPIIVRGKEKEGVKFWGFGQEIYQELLNIMVDPDYGDIADLTSGRDITVTYLTPKEAGNKYGKVSIRVKPNASIATNNKEIAQKIVKEQPNLSEIYPCNTYEELKSALNKWLNPEDAIDVSNDEINKARTAAIESGIIKDTVSEDKEEVDGEVEEKQQEKPPLTKPKTESSSSKTKTEKSTTKTDPKVDDLLSSFDELLNS